MTWLPGRTTHFGGEVMRVEHWENAIDQGTHAGRRLLAELDAAVRSGPIDPFASVPWFWTDQYDAKIQMVGRASAQDEVVIVDGCPERTRFVALFRRGDQCRAALGVNRPRLVVQARMRLAESLDWDGVAFAETGWTTPCAPSGATPTGGPIDVPDPDRRNTRGGESPTGWRSPPATGGPSTSSSPLTMVVLIARAIAMSGPDPDSRSLVGRRGAGGIARRRRVPDARGPVHPGSGLVPGGTPAVHRSLRGHGPRTDSVRPGRRARGGTDPCRRREDGRRGHRDRTDAAACRWPPMCWSSR